MKRQQLSRLGVLLAATLILASCASSPPAGEVQDPVETEQVPTPDELIQDSSGEMEEPTEAPEVSGVPETILMIRQDESEARFIIDEVLRGSPKTVIGTSNQIAGEITVVPNAPAAALLGTISVDASTLSTDNNFRNEAIKKAILQTSQYPFITFEPTSIDGLPESVSVGDSIEFTVSGTLTIRDISNPMTFDVAVEVLSEEMLRGTASAIINRADYNLSIPSVPQVADVSEEVILELDFVAASP